MKTVAALLPVALAFFAPARAQEISDGAAASVRGGLQDFNKRRAAAAEPGAAPEQAPPKAAYYDQGAIEAAAARYSPDILLVTYAGPGQTDISYKVVDEKGAPKAHRQNSVYKKEGERWRLVSGWDLVKEHEAAKAEEAKAKAEREARAEARDDTAMEGDFIGPGAPGARATTPPDPAPGVADGGPSESLKGVTAFTPSAEVTRILDETDDTQKWRRRELKGRR